MKFWLLCAVAAAFLIVAGCSHHQSTDQLPIPEPSTSSLANIHATLSMPAQVKHLASIPFTLSLTDGQTGKPISGLRATVGLEMPKMSMPPNIVRLSPTRPGVYSGTGVFTMPGKWQATAVYVDNAGNEGSKPFPVQVK